MQWLLQSIETNFGALDARVKNDVNTQQEREKQEKKAKAERVRKIKEERYMSLFCHPICDRVCLQIIAAKYFHSVKCCGVCINIFCTCCIVGIMCLNREFTYTYMYSGNGRREKNAGYAENQSQKQRHQTQLMVATHLNRSTRKNWREK